jgi:hypothetical protein
LQILKEVPAMVGENKNTAFENWLAAYGSRLEQITSTGVSASGDQRPQAIRQAETTPKQSH